MLRLLLLALLGVSLAANAWLALAPRPAPARTTPAPTAATATVAATPSLPAAATARAVDDAHTTAVPAAARGLTWQTPVSDADFRRLAEQLRAAGFPPRLVATLVRDLYLQTTLARVRGEDTPYWQQFSDARTKETQATYRGLQAKLDEFLGPDARASLLLDPISRQRRYGNLPDAKIDAIAIVERDYNDMQQDVYRSTSREGLSVDAFQSQREQTKLINAEKLADLAKLLTPAELADYEMRNSDAARTVGRNLGEADVTPEQFAALYTARRAYDDANQTMMGAISPEVLNRRQAAQRAYYETARSQLAPEQFHSFLSNSDSNYRAVAQLPGVTPAGAYEALTLQQDLSLSLQQFRTTRPSMEQVQALYADYNARLDKALGSQAADAFRKSPRGRSFNPPQVRPSTTTATPPRN